MPAKLKTMGRISLFNLFFIPTSRTRGTRRPSMITAIAGPSRGDDDLQTCSLTMHDPILI